MKKTTPVKGQGRWTASGYELRGTGKVSDGREGQAEAGEDGVRGDGQGSTQEPMRHVRFYISS